MTDPAAECDVAVIDRKSTAFDQQIDLAVIGAGAAGLTTALMAASNGRTVVVLERDGFPSGSTSLSAGLIPAAGTRWQAQSGIVDDADQFAADIVAKSGCRQDHPMALHLAKASARCLHWLADAHQVPLDLVDGFTYPGHSVRRMHGTPSRTGAELLGALMAACDRAGVTVLTDARVNKLCMDNGAVSGLGWQRPSRTEYAGAAAVVLACNGFGANPELVARYIPEIKAALYFGHAGNTGDAVLWAQQLNAQVGHMSAYQGHGSVACPHGILISWAVMMQGGIQVNTSGNRFSNEHQGYSEQAVKVLAQPDGIGFNIFDQRIYSVAAQFEDFKQAAKAGALMRADDVDMLARVTGLPAAPLRSTLAHCQRLSVAGATDAFGRTFNADQQLSPPYYAVRVEAALFHTQGGLVVDENARVLSTDNCPISGLYAVGGAAQGVSGDTVQGYLSGNGLLSALTLGYIAGMQSAKGNRSAPAE